ncbi:MAG TPA: vitamin K epoxide reductase family protein [Candidatus Paceibacterota bacterium]
METLNNRALYLKRLAILAIVIAFVGFVDATFLTAEHYLDGPIPCSITEGCEIVTTSKFSVLFGLPIALYGALFYVSIIVLSILYLDKKNERMLKLAAYFASIAFVVSLGLVGIQAFVLHAYCFYCLMSAFLSTLLFVNGRFMLKFSLK